VSVDGSQWVRGEISGEGYIFEDFRLTASNGGKVCPPEGLKIRLEGN